MTIEHDVIHGSAAHQRPRLTPYTMQCPNCGNANLESFYRVSQVPVHSVLLMPDREAAVNYPRGEIELGYCQACGFVTNRRFDPSVHEYSTRYEETQGFSGTFNAFARMLAQQLIDRYQLRGKTILEIGCGKGEFLNLLCELGDNRGIGIDPAYVPQRGDARLAGQVEFIQDFYSEKYADLTADFICCRHTLEHIAPTYEFLAQLRHTLGDRQSLVFFELPDMMRVLREGAFWDIYYEHCSYFTTGSLARLFRATGFEVLDLELAYDGQYILLTARPVNRLTTPTLAGEDDLAEVDAAVAVFPQVVAHAQRYWRSVVDETVERGERVVVWGSGSKGVALLTTLGLGDEIAGVVDINPYRQGKFMPGTGHPIIAPEQLREIAPQHVLVMNPIYCREIQRDLERLEITAQLHPVGPAMRPPQPVSELT